MEENEFNTDPRAQLVRLLQNEKPDSAFETDAELYAQVIDDYADYARLLTDEHSRAAEAEAYRANIEDSMLALQEQFSEDEISKASELLKELAAEVTKGRFTAECVSKALKALNYEADVKAAEVKGRNAKIEEEVMAKPVTDGVPMLRGAHISLNPHADSLFDIARGA